MATALRDRPGDAGAGAAALVALALAAVLAVYWPTVAGMASTWRRSETFAHGFLVLPVCAWLLYRARGRIAAARPRASWPALPLLAVLVALWVLASALRVDVAAQAATMLMVPVAVLLVFGPEVLAAARFPLLFALLAVPFGEFLMPALMDVTASGSVLLLQLTGIPVHRDGWLISIPEGNFQVAEACSGVRYLIAAVTTAVLFGHFFFASLRKQIIFIGFTAVLTVLANVGRAYIIILLARLTDMRLAVGVDHFIYGWFLFAVLLAVVLVVGLRFADRPAPGPPPATGAWRGPGRGPVAAAVAAAAVALAGPAALARVEVGAAAAAGPFLPGGLAAEPVVEVAGRPDWLQDGIGGDAHLAYRGQAGGFGLHVFTRGPGGGDVGTLRPYLDDAVATLVADEAAPGAGAYRQMRLEVDHRPLLVGYWFAVGGRQTANPVTAKIMESLTILRGEHQRPALLAVALETSKLDQPGDALRAIVERVAAAVSACNEAAPGRVPEAAGGCRPAAVNDDTQG